MLRPLVTSLVFLSLVAAVRADGAAQPGRVTGTVRVAGAPPEAKRPQPATVDPEVCGPEVADESLVVAKDGGLRDAVVVLRGALPATAGERPEAVVDNAHCRFVPRVQVVTRGQGVRVGSSDPVLHNVHPVLVAEPEVTVANLALAVPGQAMDLTRRLAATLPASGEALVRLGCDVHPWMRGWLVVLDHHYAAVTGADGRFVIAEVPPGAYTVTVWHELLRRAEQRVTVRPATSVTIEFTLAAPRGH